jgi:phosphoribosyl-ATP pyrophosphohydrolase
MTKYEETIEILCNASRMKMTLNSHKGNIEALSTEKLIENLLSELDEINEATMNDDHEKVIVEASDAMNYLIAITYNAINNYRRRKEK